MQPTVSLALLSLILATLLMSSSYTSVIYHSIVNMVFAHCVLEILLWFCPELLKNRELTQEELDYSEGFTAKVDVSPICQKNDEK